MRTRLRRPGPLLSREGTGKSPSSGRPEKPRITRGKPVVDRVERIPLDPGTGNRARGSGGLLARAGTGTEAENLRFRVSRRRGDLGEAEPDLGASPPHPSPPTPGGGKVIPLLVRTHMAPSNRELLEIQNTILGVATRIGGSVVGLLLAGCEQMRTTLRRSSAQPLYEEVWSESLTLLGPRYGLSEVRLTKPCDRLLIPRPGVGYWAKLKRGKAPTRPQLPPAVAKIREVVCLSMGASCKVPTENVPVGTVGMRLTKPHPLVQNGRSRCGVAGIAQAS